MSWILPVIRRLILATLVLIILLTACRSGEEASLTATPLSPTPTSTPPPRALTVCLGQEPNTLYIYGNPNAAARSVLSAIYDGPIDHVNYQYEPVILEKLPNLKDGDALLESVTVSAGDEVVDAGDALVTLNPGVRVYPSGCRNDNCIVEYDGASELKMDQLVVTFTLWPDLAWSDGTPLTANDSVYAYNLASDVNTPGSKYLFDRTESYEAVDELTAEWRGKPGYIDTSYFTNFWSPLPQHIMKDFTASELPQADAATRAPIGWGAYTVEEWSPGDHIRLIKNPFYFREGLPKFDTLIFRFIGDPDAAISALLAGECDLLDASVRLDGQVGLLLELLQSNQILAEFSTTTILERLDFGIRPASYDDGYNTATGGDRADIFGDKRTRQAIAMCLDRQEVVDTVLYGLSVVPNTYFPPDHPLYKTDVAAYAFDVTAANELLDQIGWKDLDNDATTPRQAQGAVNVPAGTPLILNYFTTSAAQRRQVSEILSQSLAQCSIGVNIQYYTPADFYAPGPVGPLFGRSFDLAHFSMGTAGLEPPCSWYLSSDIPASQNQWVGANVSGYSNADYDTACQTAMRSLPDDADYRDAHGVTQAIFAEDLPAVPLYLRLKIAAGRPDLCNFTLEATSSNDLWNIEAIDYGSDCVP